MAQRRQDTGAARDLGRRLTKLRKGIGNPSWRELERTMYDKTGRWLSANQLDRLHTGLTDPNKVEVENLFALTLLYEVAPADLGRVVAERCAKVLLLAAGNGPNPGSGLGYPPRDSNPEPAGNTLTLLKAPVGLTLAREQAA